MSTPRSVTALSRHMYNRSSIYSSQAYYLRTDDDWTKIAYEAKAESWMKPLVRGKDTGIVEIPANW